MAIGDDDRPPEPDETPTVAEGARRLRPSAADDEPTLDDPPARRRASGAPPDDELSLGDARGDVAETLQDTSSGRGEELLSVSAELGRSTGGASFSITKVADTLHWQDVARTRSFLGLTAVVALAVCLPLPWLGGHPVAKWVLAGSVAVLAAGAFWLRGVLRDPEAYTPRRILLAAYACVAVAVAALAYFGPFSPAAIVIPFGLYTFGLSRGSTQSFSIYVACALSYLVLAAAVGFGGLPDPGLITAGHLSHLERVLVVLLVEALILATFLSARMSRKATADALAHHDRAVRALAGREALLNEARLDLERVLRDRGLGRFTDVVVGPYRLGTILGRGGMGEVYDAVHVDSEEPVAVKLLHPHVLEEPESVQRFFRECRMAAALKAPNVVRVLQTSDENAPVPYIAMERLQGRDLADRLRAEGRMRVGDVLRLLRQVGRGLDAARQARIVHRDIKPRNLFEAELSSGEMEWKILDFGVSKLMTEATMTQQHVVGTPSYMAPEQATGGEVSHRTDVFALGVIAYRALTGRPAFTGEGAPAILFQVVHRMPPRPTRAGARLPDDVDDVLGIALAKDPWDRFDSAAELADALEKAAKGRLPAALRQRAASTLAKHPWGE